MSLLSKSTLLPRNFSNRAYRIFVPRSPGKRVVAFRSMLRCPRGVAMVDDAGSRKCSNTRALYIIITNNNNALEARTVHAIQDGIIKG